MVILDCDASLLQSVVNGSLIGLVRGHTMSPSRAILNVVTDLVGNQIGVLQLLRAIGGKRERGFVVNDGLFRRSAGSAYSQTTQQRRRGGDAGEKFPHLHELAPLPFFYCCWVFNHEKMGPTYPKNP